MKFTELRNVEKLNKKIYFKNGRKKKQVTIKHLRLKKIHKHEQMKFASYRNEQ